MKFKKEIRVNSESKFWITIEGNMADDLTREEANGEFKEVVNRILISLAEQYYLQDMNIT